MHRDQSDAGVATTVAIAALGLAAAQGIGRFAFTPLFPLMQASSGVTLAEGAWLAATNYVGYLIGALLCTFRRPSPAAAARGGLVGVAVFTMAMGVTQAFASWLLWRLLAGVASAFALVGISALAMATLAVTRREHLAGWVFAGVGFGLFVSGIVGLALGAAHISPRYAWIGLGIAACLAALPQWREPAATLVARTPAARYRFDRDARLMIACYAAYGFGYIVPATFLPALAREAIPDPAVFGWTWPVFGAAATLSTIGAALFLQRAPPRRLWAACHVCLAIGVLLPALSVQLWVLLVAALLVGGSFVVVTMVAMQEARRRAGAAALALMSAMTAAFAAGQIAGPILVSIVPAGTAAIRWPSLAAAVSLLISGALLLRAPPATEDIGRAEAP